MGRDIVNAGSTSSSIARGLGRVPGAAAGGVALVGDTMMQCFFYGGFLLAARHLACDAARVVPDWSPV